MIAVAGGGYHSLAVKTTGTVVAWGYNNYGQTNVPVGLSNVIAVAAGGLHSLALKKDGTVVAWGYNDYGQATVPAGLSKVIAIAAGGKRSLALKADGSLVAWGYYVPSSPPAASNAVVIAVGSSDFLALKPDGGLVAWAGRIGIPPTLTNVTAIAAPQALYSGSSTFFVAAIGNGLPSLTIQPVSQTTAKGATVQFHARAVGT